jgi:hypothetical protein
MRSAIIQGTIGSWVGYLPQEASTRENDQPIGE